MKHLPLYILHLEDSELDAELVNYALQELDRQCQIDWVDDFSAYKQALVDQQYDLILSDYSLPDCDGMKAFAEAKKRAPQTPFILVTGALGEELTIDTIKAGVTDYVLKTNLIRLQTAVPRAIEEAQRNREKQQTTDALRLSEERFDLAVRGSGAGIWDWGDVSVEQMWWSPRIYEMIGYQDSEIPATNSQLADLTHPEDRAAAAAAMSEHFANTQPYDVEFRVRHKNGHYIWLRSRGKAIWDKNGVPRRMAGYVQDITDRKQAQKQLLAREKDLLRAQEVAKIGTWTLDIPNDKLLWTAETYRIFGVQNRSGFGGNLESFVSYIHPEDLDYITQKWTQALAGEEYDVEHRIITGTGQVKFVREVAEVEFDETGNPVRGIGVVHDLTDQRVAEAEQRKTDEKYRTITASAHDAIVMINSAGLVTFWNPAAENIFGYSAEEVLNLNIHQLLVPDILRDKALVGMKHFAATGEGPLIGQALEVSGLDKQGRKVPLELSLNAVWQDEEWQAIGILRDISERKEAEAQQLALEKQLRQTQKMEAIGTLAGGIAHDFNNILASILGYTSMVERRLEEGSREQQDLQEVLKAAGRAKQLVRQILTYSRMGEQEKTPIHLDMVIKEVLRLIRASLPSTIDVVTDLQAEGETILGDETQIHQVLMNLCTNAYQAMPEGGSLSVTLKKIELDETNLWGLKSGNYLQLLVADTGSGIDPVIIDKIFDPYFTTKDVDTGTGLGLSVVSGIVAGLDGFIGVKSELGEGTSFRLIFPCYQDEGGAAGQKGSAAEVVGGTEHILFIDDEPNLTQLGKDFLEPLGYRVTLQTSSLDALLQVETDPQEFDLVITDQTMPRMTGIELAKQLKQVAPDLPVILCSGLKYSLDTAGVSDTAICRTLLKTELKDSLPGMLREIFDQ